MEAEHLRESEANYRALADQARAAIAVLQKGRRVYCNARWVEMTGYSAEAYEEKPVFSLIHPDDLDFVVSTYQEVVAGMRAQHDIECRMIAQSSDPKWISITLSHIQWAGQPAVIASAEEITERKRTESALQKSEEKLRLLTEASVVGIYIIQEAKIVYVNPSMAKMFGYAPEEMIGRLSLADLIHPDDIHTVMRRFQERLGGFVEANNIAYKAIRKDGSPFYIEAYGSLSEYEGKPAVMGTLIDITDRTRSAQALQRAHQKLQESEQLARTLLNATNDIAHLIEEDGTIIDLNDAMALNLDMSREELIGTCVFDQFTPDHAARKQAVVQRVIHEQQPVRFMDTGRSVHVYDSSVYPAPPSGNGKRRVVVFAHDITERQRAEDALQASEEQHRLLIEHLQAGVVVHAVDTSILLSNPQASILLGLSSDQLMGKMAMDPVWQFIHEDETPMPIDEYPVNRVLATREPMGNVVIGIHRPNTNDRTWALVSAYPQLNPRGDLQHIVVTFVDITERKRAEDALRASEQRYALLFHGSPAMLSIQRVSDRRFVEVNQAWQALTGYSRDEALSLPSSDLNLWTDLARREKLMHELVAQGTSRAEVQIRHKSGATRYVLLSSELIEIAGEQYLQSMGQDITEIKQAQARIETHMQKLVAINAIDAMIASSYDLQVTLKAIIETAATKLGVDAAAILLLTPASHTLAVSVGYGFRSDLLAGSQLRVDECFAGRAVIARRRVHIEDLAQVAGAFTSAELIAHEGFSDYMGVPLIAKGEIKGVLEIYQRAPLSAESDWLNFLETLAGHAAIAIDNAQSFERLQRANLDLSLAYDATIEGWSRAMDLRDKETEGHSLRVTELTLAIARAMDLDDEQIVLIRRGALLHDMGKLGVPDHVLLKPGKLDAEEWALMRRHPQYAYEMLSPITFLRPALDIPYCHHEKWDGTGYPRGLRGEQIPLAARIFTVVDVWDALTSDRPYRAAWSKEQALAYITESSGSHFDPAAVAVFLRVIRERAKVPEA